MSIQRGSFHLRVRGGASACAVGLLLAGAPAAAQETPGVVFKANALEVSFRGRVQTQFNTTSVESEPATELELRRVRLEASARVNDLVSVKIQPEFAGSRVSLRDAYVRFDFSPYVQLLAGQAHRPFGTITQSSSARILPIERGVRIRGLPGALEEHELVSGLGYADRDVGLQLLSDPERAFSYAAGFFNGPARAEAGAEETYQLAARVAARPAEALQVGASWSRRDFVTTEGQPQEEVELHRGQAWALDVEWGEYAPGLHVVGELAYGDFNPAADVSFLGVQGWLGYRTPPVGSRGVNVEPVLRVSYGDPDAGAEGEADGGGTLFTPGINFYFGPLNRIMLNYDLWSPEDGEREGSFRAQFQVAF